MITILAQAEDTATKGGSTWVTLLLYAVVLGGLFYFLMVRPQRKRLRDQQQLLSALAPNDEVVTIGGIYGHVEFVGDAHVILRTEGGGKLRVARQAIARKVTG
jgi:preprotein translocase subunit YajC